MGSEVHLLGIAAARRDDADPCLPFRPHLGHALEPGGTAGSAVSYARELVQLSREDRARGFDLGGRRDGIVGKVAGFGVGPLDRHQRGVVRPRRLLFGGVVPEGHRLGTAAAHRDDADPRLPFRPILGHAPEPGGTAASAVSYAVQGLVQLIREGRAGGSNLGGRLGGIVWHVAVLRLDPLDRHQRGVVRPRRVQLDVVVAEVHQPGLAAARRFDPDGRHPPAGPLLCSAVLRLRHAPEPGDTAGSAADS